MKIEGDQRESRMRSEGDQRRVGGDQREIRGRSEGEWKEIRGRSEGVERGQRENRRLVRDYMENKRV